MRKFPKYSEVPVKGRLKVCLSLLKKERLKDKILVDVGCSFGWFLSKLEKCKLRKAIGIDPNKKAVELARRNVSFADFFVSEAGKLPLKDRSADLITMFDVIEHVPKREELKTLKEIARVLKKGGKFFLSTPNSHLITNLLDPAWYLGHRHYKPGKVEKFMKKAGFKVLKIETRGNLWSITYMLWFYVMKWVFRQTLPRNKWLEEKDDDDYLKKGVFTIFVTAEKL